MDGNQGIGGVGANSSSDFVSCDALLMSKSDSFLTLLQVRKLYKYVGFARVESRR